MMTGQRRPPGCLCDRHLPEGSSHVFTIEGESFTCEEVQRARVVASIHVSKNHPIAITNMIQSEQAALAYLLRVKRETIDRFEHDA